MLVLALHEIQWPTVLTSYHWSMDPRLKDGSSRCITGLTVWIKSLDLSLLDKMLGRSSKVQKCVYQLYRECPCIGRTQETKNEGRKCGRIHHYIWTLGSMSPRRLGQPLSPHPLHPRTPQSTCWCLYRHGITWNIPRMESGSTSPAKELDEEAGPPLRAKCPSMTSQSRNCHLDLESHLQTITSQPSKQLV